MKQILTILVFFVAITSASALDWLTPLIDEKGRAANAFSEREPGRPLHVLRFGTHSYAPENVASPECSMLIAPFQQLYIDTVSLAGAAQPDKSAARAASRDPFWDQVILADPGAIKKFPRYELVETGNFGSALPAHVRAINLTDAEVAAQRARLDDPVIPNNTSREIPWRELEGAAFPLDFQKILLASVGDENPGFAWQNGQWITTWHTRDPRLAGDAKEDHWFAPALLIGNQLIRPAPLSAKTSFRKTGGITLPMLELEWMHEGATIRQTLFSFRHGHGDIPHVFAKFEICNAPPGARFAIGAGFRPNCHRWDNTELPRTPAFFFSLEPRYKQSGGTVIDDDGNLILAAVQPFDLESLGSLEKLLVFEIPDDGIIQLATPQAPIPHTNSMTKDSHADAGRDFTRFWRNLLSSGAQVRLPDAGWMERIDIWRSQVETITRVHYENRERLSYGAYFYQYYFGIEEAWPAISQAHWGRFDEAQRQAEIMLEPGNLDKTNIHHQSRNGAAPLAAATVARLSRDRAWLERVAPAMLDCAQWTQRVRYPDADTRAPFLQGLLPPHIYGGDVRDPATSLYASAACWRGLDATATIFRDLGTPALASKSKVLASQAADLRERLSAAFHKVTIRESESVPFVPFAVAIPSLNGKNEGPHSDITATLYGNYWSLFAPSFLELGFRGTDNPAKPNIFVFEYAASHGGHWGGLPRFYAGLDAAYMGGYIGWLIEESTRDSSRRHQALASLQSFMLHGSSRNGHTIPEVAGLFPHRLQAAAYERLVREAPWSFGMYDANRYLDGQISFTEPLGSVAGAALSLMRHALVTETRAANGDLNGGLMLFAAVPSAWFSEGEIIEMRDMPTDYGTLDVTMRSRISSAREIEIDYAFKPHETGLSEPVRITVRLAPPGETMKEITLAPHAHGFMRVEF